MSVASSFRFLDVTSAIRAPDVEQAMARFAIVGRDAARLRLLSSQDRHPAKWTSLRIEAGRIDTIHVRCRDVVLQPRINIDSRHLFNCKLSWWKFHSGKLRVHKYQLAIIALCVFMLFTIFIFALKRCFVDPALVSENLAQAPWTDDLSVLPHPRSDWRFRDALAFGSRLSRPMGLLRNVIRQCIGWVRTLARTARKV